MTKEALIGLGFTLQEAEQLSNHEGFHHKTKNEAGLRELFRGIAEVYGCDEAEMREAVLKHPPFANLDHERVVREATTVYGDADAVKKIIMKWSPFASYDHARVVQEATAVYGDADAVKKAVLKFPPFAGLDHERVVRERARLGRITGMKKEEVIKTILANPVLAGYSAKRYVAGLDIGRKLRDEGFTPDKEMLRIFFRHVSKSPYVPGTKRKRISQAGAGCKESPLLKEMRNTLVRGRC